MKNVINFYNEEVNEELPHSIEYDAYVAQERGIDNLGDYLGFLIDEIDLSKTDDLGCRKFIERLKRERHYNIFLNNNDDESSRKN